MSRSPPRTLFLHSHYFVVRIVVRLSVFHRDHKSMVALVLSVFPKALFTKTASQILILKVNMIAIEEHNMTLWLNVVRLALN